MFKKNGVKTFTHKQLIDFEKMVSLQLFKRWIQKVDSKGGFKRWI
jgi:hypothetical protein